LVITFFGRNKLVNFLLKCVFSVYEIMAALTSGCR